MVAEVVNVNASLTLGIVEELVKLLSLLLPNFSAILMNCRLKISSEADLMFGNQPLSLNTNNSYFEIPLTHILLLLRKKHSSFYFSLVYSVIHHISSKERYKKSQNDMVHLNN